MIRDLLHTVGALAAVGSTALYGPLVIGVALVDPRAADSIVKSWCDNLLAAAGVRAEVNGREHLPARTCVFVCNHQSNFDAPFIVTSLDRHLGFVAKKELFRIPIFGAVLRATGNISVERTGREKDREALRRSVEAVRERVSILFFAEGTRSDDGLLRRFKKGAAILAIEAGVPVVPLAVAGAREIAPKGSLWVRGRRPIVLEIGEPLPTDGLTLADRDALTDRAQAAVAVLLDRGNHRVEALADG